MTTFRFSFAILSVSPRAWARPLGAVAPAISAMLCAALARAAGLPVLKVGDQALQTRGILEASGQLEDLPYRIEWFNFPAVPPLASLAGVRADARPYRARFG